MYDLSGPARLSLVALALLLTAGCAQPSPSESSSTQKKRPPSDHWDTSPSHRVATLAALDHKAVLVLDCAAGDGLTTLIVVPERRPPVEKGHRPVTVTFDDNVTFTQSWYTGSKGGYGIGDFEPGFVTLMDSLREHQKVRFVLHRSETDVDDHSFTLNGARDAIDTVLSACGTKS